MRAIVIDRYGGPEVLHLEEVEKPVPTGDRVLVRVRASSVNPYDWHFLTGTPKLFRPSFGIRKPRHRILGADLAGTVEAVGPDVTRFSPGDEVFGQSAALAFAEYTSIRETLLAPKPAQLTFEQAAAVPLAGVTALQAIRDAGRVSPGAKVLIVGASGGVGTFAVQIAASMGAEVTGVCSAANADLVRSLGARNVIDYTREDFASGDGRYDVVFDNIVGHSVTACRGILEPGGIYLASGGRPERKWLGPLGFIARMAVANVFTRKTMRMFLARQSADDLAVLTGMIEAGDLMPVIDRSFPLSEVPDAFRHLATWHARGKVVITH
jgi:NADPH:quinone reductase-like Zn-dependent oxidoreductase